MSTALKQSYDAQNYLWTVLQTTMHNCVVYERRIHEYHQAYKSAMNEANKLDENNRDLRDQLARTDNGNVALERKLDDLDTTANALAEKNIFLSQDLHQAREKIRLLEDRVKELEHLPSTTVDLKDVVVHELDSGEEKSPASKAFETDTIVCEPDTGRKNKAGEVQSPSANNSGVPFGNRNLPQSGLKQDEGNVQSPCDLKIQTGRVAQRRARKRRNRVSQTSVPC